MLLAAALTWEDLGFWLPLPAALVGLWWVLRHSRRCGRAGPLALVGLGLVVLSVTIPAAVDIVRSQMPAVWDNRSLSTARNAVLSGGRLIGGLLLVAAVMADRPPAGRSHG